LVDDLEIDVVTEPVGDDDLITVRLRGRLAAVGPVPITIPVETQASSVRPGEVD
jgi:hypothetical protein